MNYSYMYGYYIGEIFKKVYEDWPKYNDNPKLIFKELIEISKEHVKKERKNIRLVHRWLNYKRRFHLCTQKFLRTHHL